MAKVCSYYTCNQFVYATPFKQLTKGRFLNEIISIWQVLTICERDKKKIHVNFKASADSPGAIMPVHCKHDTNDELSNIIHIHVCH